MILYAIIIDKETGRVDVGLGSDEIFYASRGMKKMEVEQAKDGTWYLKGKVKEREISLEAQLLKKEQENMMPRWQRDEILKKDSTYSKSIRLKAQEIENLAEQFRDSLKPIIKKKKKKSVKKEVKK